ncbi:hypothetical protein [Streptomyces chartreusis]|uniref:hypothetical protein n=1 Tax=Streptomyces chartreusis TaxID=1969 RepID=UPI003866D488|nr:hypothetical protein OG938_48525 [Streptomyces chartreusis]
MALVTRRLRRPSMPVWWRRPPAPGSRRSQRQRALAELRAQGRHGPELRDVLPAFLGLGAAALGLVLLLVWAYRAFGVGGLVVMVVSLAAAAVAGLRWHRAVVRRRGGRYTAAELGRLDGQGLAVAAGRMLRRDGWRVADLSERGQLRLYAQRRGRELDLAFRPAVAVDAEPAGGPAPLREAGRPGVDHLTRVVVSPGGFSRADVLWASRQGGVHLLDGHQLQRWAEGATLEELGLPR